MCISSIVDIIRYVIDIHDKKEWSQDTTYTTVGFHTGTAICIPMQPYMYSHAGPHSYSWVDWSNVLLKYIHLGYSK